MKSLNLQPYGVVEMSQDEMQEVDGGILPLLAAAALCCLVLSSCINSPVNIQVGSNSNSQTASADSTANGNKATIIP
jgi:lactobin A/cerein 7B family class IIb bacteriocin